MKKKSDIQMYVRAKFLIFTCGYFSQSITFENQGCGVDFVLFNFFYVDQIRQQTHFSNLKKFENLFRPFAFKWLVDDIYLEIDSF